MKMLKSLLVACSLFVIGQAASYSKAEVRRMRNAKKTELAVATKKEMRRILRGIELVFSDEIEGVSTKTTYSVALHKITKEIKTAEENIEKEIELQKNFLVDYKRDADSYLHRKKVTPVFNFTGLKQILAFAKSIEKILKEAKKQNLDKPEFPSLDEDLTVEAAS